MTHRHRKEREARRFASRKSSPKAKKIETPKVENQPAVETKEETISEDKETAKYTKSEINRSNLDTLKKIASEEGIEDIDDKTGGELKKLIIEKLGL